MPFAQLVIGPPGAGKSTYCAGMQQFLSAIGRQSAVVNLDPASADDSSSSGAAGTGDAERAGIAEPLYRPALDVRHVAAADTIQVEAQLGPNGAILAALEALEAPDGWAWLQAGLQELGEAYVLFDCPGQVELFTHHASLRNVVARIEKMGYRLVVLHLVDAYCLTQPSLYLSSLLLALRAMLQMDLPHINVLTKIDKLASYDRLPFPLEFYTSVQDLSYLLPHLEAESPRFSEKFAALNAAIVQLVEDFALVGFETLAVEDRRSMMTLLQAVDRAGGYAFGSAEGAGDDVWQVAMREGYRGLTVQDVQERWVDRQDEFDERERRDEEERLSRQALAAEEASKKAAAAVSAASSESIDDDEKELEKFRQKGGDPGVKVVRKS